MRCEESVVRDKLVKVTPDNLIEAAEEDTNEDKTVDNEVTGDKGDTAHVFSE